MFDLWSLPFSYSLLKHPGAKIIPEGVPFVLIPLIPVVLYHPVWTMDQDPPPQLTVLSEATLRGKDATRPRKRNQEC